MRAMGRGSKVYIVDADSAVRESMSALLQTVGIASCLFPSIAAMLAAFDASEAGCITADLGASDAPGLSMMGTLRGLGHSVPVILFSARWDAEKKRLVEKAGAAVLLAKPPDPAQFLQLVRRLLEDGTHGES